MLIVRHSRCWYEPKLPHLVLIDNRYVGTMQGDELRIDIPRGHYRVRIQFGGWIPIGKKGRGLDMSVSAIADVELHGAQDTTLNFHDRERVWNILFDVDLLLWIVSLFVPLPPLYKVLSDLFFAVWIVRLLLIRKRYYRIEVRQQ